MAAILSKAIREIHLLKTVIYKIQFLNDWYFNFWYLDPTEKISFQMTGIWIPTVCNILQMPFFSWPT